jgi:CheY-specific phosphatase CheX
VEAATSEFVQAFVAATFYAVTTLLSETPERGDLSIEPSGTTTSQVNVVIDVNGELNGQIVMGMTLATADKIASAMHRLPIVTFDKLAATKIREMAAMIIDIVAENLSQSGPDLELGSPTIVRGVNARIAKATITAIVIPIRLPFGEISLSVGLEDGDKLKRPA